MNRTSVTTLFPVVGNPMGQSYSSKMANGVYQQEGFNCIRFPIEVELEHLGDVINSLRCMNAVATGVTKPFKIAVMQHLDEIDLLAKRIGAVNLVLKKGEKLVGFNIDGMAFLRSLVRETGCMVKQSTFFAFGAGGAGRAICWTLAQEGIVHLYVTDKVSDAAWSLADDINQVYPGLAEAVDYEDKDAVANAVGNAQVVMNISGMGMAPHLDETPMDAGLFRPEQIAFDAIYNPSRSRFLQDAERAGCCVINGQGMQIYCGMLGYEALTGKAARYEQWERSYLRVSQKNTPRTDTRKKRILMMHGINHNMFGHRDPNLYGVVTYEQINERLLKAADELGVELEIFQSNFEGEYVEKIHQAFYDKIDAVLYNPGGWTHSVGVMDALSILTCPKIEVHMSNTFAKHNGVVAGTTSKAASSLIIGLGLTSYTAALRSAVAQCNMAAI